MKKRRFAKVLSSLDMSLEELLEQCPYPYGHCQGESVYRIFNKHFEEKYIGFANTSFDAELWIVEQYYTDKKEIQA